MNNPNPFVPQGSLQDQQSKRQSRMKLAVFCVLAVSVTGLMAMLVQGCNRNKPVDTTSDSSLPAPDTNAISTLAPEPTNSPDMGSNMPPSLANNPPPPVTIPAPAPAPLPVTPTVTEAPVPAAGSDYTVVHGDTLAKIAKKNGVSLHALKEANPTVQPTKLKVGQKLTIPAGGKAVDATASVGAGSTDTGSSEVYVVKSGDTLTRIAKSHGTTVKAIQAANNLTTTRITVGKKLKMPVKAEAPAVSAPVPVDNTPAPVNTAPTLPPVSAPAPATTPAPAH